MKGIIISKLTKKSLVLIMVLALAFTLVPMVPNSPVGDAVEEAMANTIDNVDDNGSSAAIYIDENNVLYTSPDCLISGTVGYDQSTCTLTLTDVVASGADFGVYIATNANITITGSAEIGSFSGCGISAMGNMNLLKSKITITSFNSGIVVMNNNNLVVNESQVDVNAGLLGVAVYGKIIVIDGSISSQIVDNLSMVYGGFGDSVEIAKASASSMEVGLSFFSTFYGLSSQGAMLNLLFGSEFISGIYVPAPSCIYADNITTSPEGAYLNYFSASGSDYVKTKDFKSLSSPEAEASPLVTDIIKAASSGVIVTLSSKSENNTSLYLPDPYVEAIDGTLHKSSEVNFYNEALHQKEVAQIQNDVKDWKVTVRTTLAKKGIKLYAYLNGFDTEELYSYLDKGYTVQYDWYKAAGKNKKYKYVDSTDNNYFYDKDVKSSKTYFYKCKITIYDENGKIVRTQLKDCKYGCRKFK